MPYLTHRRGVCAAVLAAATVGVLPSPAARADVFGNVPAAELNGYSLVYNLNIPDKAAFNGKAVPYSVDNHASITQPWDRVAYYLELKDASNVTTYAYASMDAFGAGIRRIGIPSVAPGGTIAPLFQKKVTNLNVYSNSPNVTTGTGIATGNIEFWSSNYSQANGIAIPNASASNYDFGDTATAGGYGSFQIHNHGASQTIIGYNNWGNAAGTNSDLGIGNAPLATAPDWTFAANANTFTVKQLQVLVHTTANTFTDPATKTPLAAGYKQVYGLQIPRAGFGNNTHGAPYQVDRTEAVTGGISRIGYYLELHKKTDPAGQNQYVFVSMDAFTQDPTKIGLPTLGLNTIFQQNVNNLSVASNVAGVVTGENLGTGNIEFWPSNYAGAKTAGTIPANARDTLFDFGDSGGGTGAGYGSFQIHNAAAAQTILAYNNWSSGGGDSDVGIGNNTIVANGAANPDWTFRNNAFNDYDVRDFQVLVLDGAPTPEPAALGLIGLGGLTLLRRRRR
jgi:MYXO-CTERM domain-containing protein